MNTFGKKLFVTLLLISSTLTSNFALEEEKFVLEIHQFINRLIQTENIKHKIAINDSLTTFLEAHLKEKSTFEYKFDSLNYIGVVAAPDNLFKIFNWHIKLTADIYMYCGIIQYNDETKDSCRIITLKDNSDNIKKPEKTVCSDTSWYGALYYDIIKKEFTGKTLYTLLGFDYNSHATRKKIIDVLYFKDNNVYFGYPIFRSKVEQASRVIFEYSANAMMTLKYNKEQDIIIFDHLSPSKPTLEGHYAYYGPDFSHDAFKFNENYWEFIHSIDIRNPKKNK